MIAATETVDAEQVCPGDVLADDFPVFNVETVRDQTTGAEAFALSDGLKVRYLYPGEKVALYA